MRVRDLPGLGLHAELITPTGRHYRWADDEPKAANVPGSVTFSSTAPGGFEQSDCVLPRKPGVDYNDLERFSTLRWLGPGGEVAWEGRLQSAPRTSGDQMAVSPSAVGWQAHLDDDQSVVVIYRDVDLSRWTGPSNQRRLSILAGGRTAVDPSTLADTSTGLPAIGMELDGAWATGIECDAVYDAGQTKVARIYWDRISQSDQGGSQPSATFEFQAGVADADTLSGNDLSGDLHTIGLAHEAQAFIPSTPKRWAVFLWRFAAANTTDGQYTSVLRNVAVYGQTGRPIRGSEPNAGHFASDIVLDVVAKWAPLLNVTADSVVASAFIIPQAAFHDPTTAAEIINQVTAYGLQDWGVWEDRVFYWAPRGTFGRKWRARIAPAQLSETGPSADRLYNSVVVTYSDVDGSTRTVGPIGSGADTEDASLHDPDPENPVNKLGITRRALLQMGITSTAAAAVQVGARFLAEQKLLDRSGSAQLVGHVADDRGIVHPAWKVRAGDTIVFTDASDTSERRIVKASYDQSSRTCSVDLDAPPDGMAELLARLGVVLAPLGLS